MSHESGYESNLNQSQVGTAEIVPAEFPYSVSAKDFERQGFSSSETELQALRAKLRSHARLLREKHKIPPVVDMQELKRKLRWKNSRIETAVQSKWLVPSAETRKLSQDQWRVPFSTVNACDLIMSDSRLEAITTSRGGNAYYRLLLRVSDDEQRLYEAQIREAQRIKDQQKLARKAARFVEVEASEPAVAGSLEVGATEVQPEVAEVFDPLSEANLFELAYLAADPTGHIPDVLDHFQGQSEEPLTIQEVAHKLLRTFDAISIEKDNQALQSEWKALRDSSGVSPETFNWPQFINYLEDLALTGTSNIVFQPAAPAVAVKSETRLLKGDDRIAARRLARTSLEIKNKLGETKMMVTGQVLDAYPKLLRNGLLRAMVELFPDEIGVIGADGIRRFSQADVALLLTLSLEIENPNKRVLIDLAKIKKYKAIYQSVPN